MNHYSKNIQKILLIANLAILVHLASISPSLTLLTDVETGTYVFDTTPYFTVVANANVNAQWNINLVSAKSTPSYQCGISIQNLELLYPNHKLDFEAQIFSINAAQIIIKVSSSMADSLKNLKIRYIAIESTFPYIHVGQLSTPYGMGSVLQDGDSISSIYSVPTYNTSTPLRVMVALVGFDLSSANGNCNIKPSVKSANSAQLTLTINTLSSMPHSIKQIVNHIRVTYVLYSESEINDLSQGLFYYKSYTFTNSYLDSNSNMVLTSSNSFFGLSGFYIINTSELNFTCIILSNTNFKSINQPAISKLNIDLIVFMKRQCVSPLYKYYFAKKQLCYQSCLDGYYFNSTMVCIACAYDCLTCLDGTNCLTCSSSINRIFNSTTLRCDPMPGYFESGVLIPNKCNANCQTCVSSSTFCLTCPVNQSFKNYYLNSSNNCAICMSNCLSCINISSCNQCALYYLFNTTASACTANCSYVNFCTTCSFNSGIYCLGCQTGYVASNGICKAKCGDNMTLPTHEECDDGNIIDGDGCSSSCKVQNNFVCNETGSSGQSICFLTKILLSQEIILKNKYSNKYSIRYILQPTSLPIYSLVNWNNILSISSNTDIISVNYNQISNQLIIDAAYNQNRNKKVITISTNYAGQPSSFKYLQNQIFTQILQTDNNLLLEYFSTDVYSLASIIEILSILVSVISVIMFMLGYFGSKIIALECIAVVQMSYLCLLTLQDVTPTYNALTMLKFSFGINSFSEYNFRESSNRQYKHLELSHNLFRNYNLTSIVIFVPILIALVCKIIFYKSQNPRKKLLNRLFQSLLGQFTLYGFIFSFSLLLISSLITSMYIQTEAIQILSVLFGAITLIVFLLYTVFLIKIPIPFGQFKQKFLIHQIWTHYYNFILVEYLISSLLIALPIHYSFQLLPLIIVFILDIIIVIIFKPYTGKRELIRPAVNKSFSVVVLIIYIVSKNISTSHNFSIIAPIIIITLLLVSTIYSYYHMFFSMKDNYLKFINFMKEVKNEKNQDNGNLQFQELHKKIISQNQSIQAIVQKNFENKPDKYFINEWNKYHIVNQTKSKYYENIKEKLNKIKIDQFDQKKGEGTEDIEMFSFRKDSI